MDKYELNFDTFKGPLEKLLELIEEKKLEITELSLADVTGDFLSYIENLKEVSPRVLSDFIQVASRLILIKSRAILPQLELTEEEEEDIVDIQERLRLYKDFRNAEENLRKMWGGRASFAREYLVGFSEGFYLSEPLTLDDLQRVIQKLYEESIVLIPKTKSIEVKFVSLEEKIGELIFRVEKTLEAKFGDVVRGKDQSEIIVLFLALLHLLKEKVIDIKQEEIFSEIHIFKNISKK